MTDAAVRLSAFASAAAVVSDSSPLKQIFLRGAAHDATLSEMDLSGDQEFIRWPAARQAAALAVLSGSPVLLRLGLSGLGLTDSVATALAGLLASESGALQVLNLERNDFHEAGLLEMIASLSSNVVLRELRLTGQKSSVSTTVETALADSLDAGGAAGLIKLGLTIRNDAARRRVDSALFRHMDQHRLIRAATRNLGLVPASAPTSAATSAAAPASAAGNSSSTASLTAGTGGAPRAHLPSKSRLPAAPRPQRGSASTQIPTHAAPPHPPPPITPREQAGCCSLGGTFGCLLHRLLRHSTPSGGRKPRTGRTALTTQAPAARPSAAAGMAPSLAPAAAAAAAAAAASTKGAGGERTSELGSRQGSLSRLPHSSRLSMGETPATASFSASSSSSMLSGGYSQRLQMVPTLGLKPATLSWGGALLACLSLRSPPLAYQSRLRAPPWEAAGGGAHGGSEGNCQRVWRLRRS